MNDLKPQRQISQRRLSRPVSLAILVAAALLAMFMTACGGKSETGTSPTTGASASPGATTTSAAQQPDAAKLVAESAKTTETLQSVHIALVATNLPNLPMETVNADVTNQPQGQARAVGDAKVRLQQGGQVQPFQFLVTDKTMYTKGPDGKYNSVGPAEKIYDPGIILDKDKGLAYIIKNVQNAKYEGKETIDGVPTVKISGTIDSAIIDPVVPRLGQGGGALPITLYIQDVAPATPTTTSLASDAPSPGSGPNLVRFVVDKDQGNVTVTLSNWAKPVEIPNPSG